MKKKNHIRILIVTGIVFALALVVFLRSGAGRNKTFIFNKNLNLQIMTVDDTPFTLEDIAFYIAYEEMKVETDAYVYNPENTNQYWNVHTNGSFVRAAAKQHVIDMAVHDYIFCSIADEKKIVLDVSEEKDLEYSKTDFYEDITDEQLQRLGVDKEKLDESMYNVAMAEKAQKVVSEEEDILYDNLDAQAATYEELYLSKHKVKLDKELWDKVDFGNVILEHKKWYE